MTTNMSKAEAEKRIRSTVLRHATDIEDRKRLQSRIADLIVEAFDLPSKTDADPARPQLSDASLFKQCLGLFQASDLDDLVYERNVDNRCGYALCPKPNQKLSHNGDLMWNKKGGKDFKLVNKAEMEKWCSQLCQERTAFVRAQLGTEPAWLRDVKAVDIKFLDEVGTDNLVESLNVSHLKDVTHESCFFRASGPLTTTSPSRSPKQQMTMSQRKCRHFPLSAANSRSIALTTLLHLSRSRATLFRRLHP